MSLKALCCTYLKWGLEQTVRGLTHQNTSISGIVKVNSQQLLWPQPIRPAIDIPTKLQNLKKAWIVKNNNGLQRKLPKAETLVLYKQHHCLQQCAPACKHRLLPDLASIASKQCVCKQQQRHQQACQQCWCLQQEVKALAKHTSCVLHANFMLQLGCCKITRGTVLQRLKAKAAASKMAPWTAEGSSSSKLRLQ